MATTSVSTATDSDLVLPPPEDEADLQVCDPCLTRDNQRLRPDGNSREIETCRCCTGGSLPVPL